jgi:hypothetical protein
MGGNLEYYAVTFGAGGVMTAGVPADAALVGTPGNEFAPITEFFNPNIGTGVDYIFFSALCTGGDMATLDITHGFPGSAFVGNNVVTEGFGTSGMIVDNDANTNTGFYPQAASIYFNALQEDAACTANTPGDLAPGSGGCAVKLTQAGLL